MVTSSRLEGRIGGAFGLVAHFDADYLVSLVVVEDNADATSSDSTIAESSRRKTKATAGSRCSVVTDDSLNGMYRSFTS